MTSGEKIHEWDKSPRMPVPAPPAGSCDCQFHIYADPVRFPPRANAPYPPIESATFAEAQRMHQAIVSLATTSSAWMRCAKPSCTGKLRMRSHTANNSLDRQVSSPMETWVTPR